MKIENEDYCEICFDCDDEEDTMIFCDKCNCCTHLHCAKLDENVVN